MRDPYEVLGIPQGSPDTVVAAAYFELASRFDPESGSGDPTRAARWKEIEDAFAALTARERAPASSAKPVEEAPLTADDVGLPDAMTPPPEEDEGLGIERALKRTVTFLLIFAAAAYALYTLLRPFGLVSVLSGVSSAGYFGLRVTSFFIPRQGSTGRFGYQRVPSQAFLNWEFVLMMVTVLSTLALVMYQAHLEDAAN